MSSWDSTIVITGGNMGLGFEAAKIVAKSCPRSLVIISSRSSGLEAAQIINKETGLENVAYIRLDLADLENVRAFAAQVKSHHPKISALVLNAGLQVLDLSYTKDGLETTFGVNHVGHALLFHLLVDHLAGDARVVITSSGTHDPAQKTGLPDAQYVTAELLAHPDHAAQKNSGRQRYASSKLCNLLWMYALERHRESAGLSFSVYALDPGLMPGTGLAREASSVLKFVWHSVLPRMLPLMRLLVDKNIHSPQESGAALARLAISPEVDSTNSGKYFEGIHAIKSSKDSYDQKKQEDLWLWTAEYLGRDKAEVERYKQLFQN